MKEIKQYRIGVSVYGPASKKTGAGIWYVAETTEKKATAALQNYFKQHNLFGSIQYAFTPSRTFISMKRGQVLSEREYFLIKEEQEKQKPYEVIPHRANGHVKPKFGTDADKAPVQGAYGSHNEPTCIEDCGSLPHVDGVTYEGRNLDAYNLENQIDEMENDYER